MQPCSPHKMNGALTHIGRYMYLQDKILQSMGRGHEVMVTNDGATILKSLYVDNPAAKVLVGMEFYLHSDSNLTLLVMKSRTQQGPLLQSCMTYL